MVLLEIIVQGHQVEPQFLWDDVDGCAASKGGIHVHHAGIETITGIGGHPVVGLKVIVALIPVAEGHEIGVGELASLGHTGGTRGV